jgi:hypothetical protein
MKDWKKGDLVQFRKNIVPYDHKLYYIKEILGDDEFYILEVIYDTLDDHYNVRGYCVYIRELKCASDKCIKQFLADNIKESLVENYRNTI